MAVSSLHFLFQAVDLLFTVLATSRLLPSVEADVAPRMEKYNALAERTADAAVRSSTVLTGNWPAVALTVSVDCGTRCRHVRVVVAGRGYVVVADHEHGVAADRDHSAAGALLLSDPLKLVPSDPS
jgi:hypothetical protein